MGYEIPGRLVTLPAGADLSTEQFKFVSVNASGAAVVPSSTLGLPVFGVLQNRPSSGQAASIMIDGVSKVQALASTVKAGDIVSASSVGYAVALGSTTADYSVGRIIAGTSGGTGRLLTIHITPIGTT